MAITYAERYCNAQKVLTTAALKAEVYGSSFDLDEAMKLTPEARSAAITIGDGVMQVNTTKQIIDALVYHGFRPSTFANCIGGIGVYARNRRTPI